MNDNNMLSEIIQRLKQDIEKLDAEIRPDRLDLQSRSDMKLLSEELDELFSFRINIFSDTSRHRELTERNNWEYLVLKRRKQAILERMPEAEERFAEKYPELEPNRELMRYNAPLPDTTFRELNKTYYIELAAAIRILDYLKLHQVYEEASRFFPTSREEINAVYLPDLSDSVHSDDELRSMIYVIRNRNRGTEGFDDKQPFCTQADTCLNNRQQADELTDRKNYDGIMALIDKAYIKTIQHDFIEALWEHFDGLLSLTQKAKRELIKKKKKLRSDVAELVAQLESIGGNKPSPLLIENRTDALQDILPERDPISELIPDLSKAAKELDKKTEETQAAEEEPESLYFFVMMIPGWVSGALPPDDSMDIYSGLSVPEIRDPYDTCLAFLSLLDENSDYPWLYSLSYNIVSFACQLLPWADSNYVDPDGSLGEVKIDYEFLKGLTEKLPDWDEDKSNPLLYAKSLPSPLRTVSEKRTNMSIAQLSFLSSGLIPPRTAASISYTKALLHESAFSAREQELLYAYFSLAYSVTHQGFDFRAPDDDQIDEELSGEEKATEDRDTEIKKLRSEIKRLKKLVNRTEHQRKALSSELSETKHRLEATNAELAELRSLIRESCEAEDSIPTTINFPYSAKKRTIIIGGHESWVKAIKPLLDNVRYIASSEQPNPGVILNAEIVWIQTNAMGHSSFYKIIDIIRKNDIKVCYFKYASAEKCAEQLALEEIEGEQAVASQE